MKRLAASGRRRRKELANLFIGPRRPNRQRREQLAQFIDEIPTLKANGGEWIIDGRPHVVTIDECDVLEELARKLI